MVFRSWAAVVPVVCVLSFFGNPSLAQELEPAIAGALERAKSQLAGGEIVAGPRTRAAEVARNADAVRARRVRIVRIQPPAAQVEAAAALPLSSHAVNERLDAVFGLVAPVEAPAEAARLPAPRPRPDEDLVALAYADSADEAREGGSGLSAIEELVEKHAEANDVPPALAHALVEVESSYNPKATGSNGEIGLLQIKPKTARAVGYKGSAKGLYDAETNIAYGMKYLGKAHDLAGGDTCGTLLRYNAGLDAKRRSAASNKFCAKVKRKMAERA